MTTIDFTDPKLFGSEAAELETEDVFFSYAVTRPEVTEFLDVRHPVRIVSAYKGEGKSALLRLAERELRKRPNHPVVVRLTASSVAPDLDTDNEDTWIREWKAKLMRLVAQEIGAKIKFAWNDDGTSLVNEAEKEGFRQRSIFGYFLARIQVKENPISENKIAIGNPEQILARWQRDKEVVWILLDDIDHNYANTPRHQLKLISFLAAIKDLMVKVPELRIRFTIRPNVWKMLRRNYEGVSHFRESLLPLTWTMSDCEAMLAKRVESYLDRQGTSVARIKRTLPAAPAQRRATLCALILETPMPWGYRATRPAVSVLYTLSRHRPRWLIELVKESSKATVKRGGSRINFDDVMSVMDNFSTNRKDDTIVEFRTQCPELQELLNAFADQPEKYTTDELFKTLTNRVLQQIRPHIVGVSPPTLPREVAHFLYEIGFLSARRDNPDGSYTHVAYSEEPDLLGSRLNLDQGFSWEIHPVFRQSLRLTSA